MFNRGALLAVVVTAALIGCGEDTDETGTTSPARLDDELQGQVVSGLGTISNAECSESSGQMECTVLTKDGRAASCTLPGTAELKGLHCGRAFRPVKTDGCLLEEPDCVAETGVDRVDDLPKKVP